MINKFKNAVAETPWKIGHELAMYLIKYPVLLYLQFICRVKIGYNSKFYGMPKIYRHSSSDIIIGNNFESRNWWFSNPIGINHPTIICTWKRGARIKIGDDVGMSGGSMVSAESIEIGSGTLIGANTTILDTDFHPIYSPRRRYETRDIKSKAIKIGKNVFIGMNCIILKGVIIPDNSVIPAGSIVRKWEGTQRKGDPH